MTDKTKEIIIKTLIVLAAIFMVSFILTPFVYPWFVEEETFSLIFYVNIILYGVFGFALMIAMPLVGYIKTKPVKAEKKVINFTKFSSLSASIHEAAKNEYIQQPVREFADDGTLMMYVKPDSFRKIECIALMYISEWTASVQDSAEDAITQSLEEYYGTDQITDTVGMIMIVCVDRVTPAFQKLVNSSVEQGFKNYRFIAGISFGSKSLYIAKQADGLYAAQFKRLRKKFLHIMQIEIAANNDKNN